jgi:hypothetical protein
VVDILLRAGADPYQPDRKGETPYAYLQWCKGEAITYRRTLGRSIYYQNLCVMVDEVYAMFRRCHYCHTTEAPTKLCSGCERVWYCSAEHQKADWPAHKAFCRAHPVSGASASASTAKNKNKNKNKKNQTKKNGGRRSFLSG